MKKCNFDEITELKEELLRKGYRHHHTAYFQGYVSRKLGGIVEEYTGKFGTGCTIKIPNYGSTRFSFIEYWVKG